MDKLKELLKNEPLRAALYPLIAFAVFFFVKDAETADVITGIVAAVLGVAGTEVARAKVTPVAKLR